MNLDIVLAVGALTAGVFSLLMGYGVIKQKIKPGAKKQQVEFLYRLQKFLGFVMIAIGLINVLEVVGVW